MGIKNLWGKEKKKLDKNQCGHSFLYGYSFCPLCGEKVGDLKVAKFFEIQNCKSLHQQRKESEEKFCHDCGTKL